MPIASLAFLLGIVVVQQFSRLPTLVESVLLFCVLAILIYKKVWPMVFFVIGLFWASLFAQWRLLDRLPVKYEKNDVIVEGVIASLPQQQDNRMSFDFAVSQPAGNFPAKIRLNWYSPKPTIKAGQAWRLSVKLKPPNGRMNPGGFDYEAWLFANHIGASGYVRTKPPPEEIALSPGLAQYFTIWRQDISDRMDAALPHGEQLGVLKALTIGSQGSINQAQWDVFRNSGTTHLIVISGSHISLIAGMVFLLVRRCWAWLAVLSVSPQQVAAVTAWLAALFYAGLAGYSIPTLRAIIMLTVALAAIVWQRNTAPLQVLLLAVGAVLIFDPFAVLSVGFWLSFIAVALLIYISAGRLGRSNYWREATTAQLATAIGLSPLLMVFFQQVSLISPLTNWLAAPIIGLLVTPLALAAILLLFLAPPLAGVLLQLTDLILQGLWWLLLEMSKWPLSTVYCLQPPWHALMTAGVGVLLLMAPRGFPARYLSLFLFLPLIFVKSEKPEPGALWLTLLDVGQGLSAVVQTSGHTLVFDTGGKFSENSDMGDAVVLPFLRWQGIARLDTLMISHNDNDHSGGAASLLAEIPVASISSSAPEWAERGKGGYCRAGQQWQWDQVRFTLLSPPETAFTKENDNSCVLKIETGKFSFLLPGDIEQNAESWLARQYGEQLKSTILIAPHHGSKTSSSFDFLNQVQPELVAIPAGYLNRFGFPHKSVTARYQQLNLQWLNTSDAGAISIRAGVERLLVESERDIHKHYWMTPREVR